MQFNNKKDKSITNINNINLYMIDIKVYFIYLKIYFIYLIYSYLIFYLSHKHFNIPKKNLFIKQLAINRLIIFNKSMIT